MRVILSLLCGLGIAGLTFTAVSATRSAQAAATATAAPADGGCEFCDAGAAPVLLMDSASAKVPATAPATQPAVDVKNTKCLVMPDDDVTPGQTVTYQGKIYHFCCDDCPKEFLKNPEKYIKALNADPKKYGVK